MSSNIETSPVLHGKKRVLVGATGSVASVKIPIIVKTLVEVENAIIPTRGCTVSTKDDTLTHLNIYSSDVHAQEIGDLVEIKVVTTNAALHFFDRKDVVAEILNDKDEWDVSVGQRESTIVEHSILCTEWALVSVTSLIDLCRHGAKCPIQSCTLT